MEYYLNNNGDLEIDWSEGKHRSCFSANWLRKNCYTIKNEKKYISPYKKWDKKLNNKF